MAGFKVDMIMGVEGMTMILVMTMIHYKSISSVFSQILQSDTLRAMRDFARFGSGTTVGLLVKFRRERGDLSPPPPPPVPVLVSSYPLALIRGIMRRCPSIHV